jgi:hypothetical protein
MKLIIAGVFLAVLCGLTDCAGFAHPTTQTTTEVIVDKTISAMNSINSYNLNTDMTENYVVFGKTDPQQTTDIWEWKSQRQIDVSNQNMYLSVNIHETPDIQPYIFQQYLMGGYSYYSQSSPMEGGATNPWMKTQLGERDTATWSNFAQVSPLEELFKTSTDFNLIGTDQINGDDCYIIQLDPSAETATDWILSQEGFPGPSLGWWIGTSPERVKQIDIKAFQNGSVKLWIGKDNSLIYKVDIGINLDAEPGNIVLSDTGLNYQEGQGNSTDVGFEKILRDFTGELVFSGYNQPVQIQLPQEALDTPNVYN